MPKINHSNTDPFVEGQVRLFRDQVGDDAWKRVHDEAMTCRDVEQVLAFGNFVFDSIMRLDERVCEEMADGRARRDPQHRQRLESLLRSWLMPRSSAEHLIRAMVDRGYQVENAERFLKNCDEAAWILKPAAEALVSDELVRLRDEAIDLLRSGKCQPLE